MNLNAATRVDPSRTTSIYHPFSIKLRSQFDSIKRAVDRLVRVEDAFNLTRNAKFDWDSDEKKLASFMRWAREQADGKLKGLSQQEAWREYVRRGFWTGVNRSYASVRAGQSRKSVEFEKGMLERFTFADAEKLDKVKLLATRTFTEMDGVTKSMAVRMSRVLADGFVKGNSPSRLAHELVDVVDIGYKQALMIARTEIVRAQAEGQLLAYSRLGVDTIKAVVEWNTAKDDDVCRQCQIMSGKKFTLKEASGLIPLHPNCRCAWSQAMIAPGKGMMKGAGDGRRSGKSKKSRKIKLRRGGRR